jgi:F-type H+-transporting ATPase subunit alpha
VERQVVAIYAATRGHLDQVPVDQVGDYEQDLFGYLERHTDVLETIATAKDLSAETEAALKAAVEEFTHEFLLTIGVLTPPEEAVAAGAEVEQEQIAVGQRRG